MAQPNPSLGITTSFDATQFRNAVRFAMQMGAPPTPDLRALFMFPSTGRTYVKNGSPVTNPRTDRDGVPLDPEIQMVDAPGSEVAVDCAVEISPADPEELPVGQFRPTKAEVTLLDVDFAQVDGCKELRYNGDRYAFGYETHGLGMFDVGVHVLTFYALDEK
jgi:hypothetical protein